MTPSVAQSSLIRIQWWVKRYLPPWMDREEIAMAILSEYLEGDIHPSRVAIYHRCLDAKRKELSRRRAETKKAQEGPREPSAIIEGEAHLDRLIDQAGLSPPEKALLMDRFYRGQSLREMALSRGVPLEGLKTSLEGVLSKIRRSSL